MVGLVAGGETEVPLSEHEQRAFEALEHTFYTHNPDFAHRVHLKLPVLDSRSRLRLSGFGLVVGLAFLFAFCWTTMVALGVVSFLLMFASLESFWVETNNLRHARQEGPARLG